MREGNSIRLLIADSHPATRAGIQTIIDGAAEIVLIGEAEDGHTTQRLSCILQPSVLLMGLSMPGPMPEETIVSVQQQSPTTRTLVYTAYETDASIRSIIALGVAGYVLKEEQPDALIMAIRTVASGGAWFSRRVMERFMQLTQHKSAPHPADILTDREREIVTLLAEGLDNTQIARTLRLAPQTVANRISRVYSKLDMRSRAELIIWARERGKGQ
jgi:DNA-binding NarL/FixJ family response regulator